MTADKDGVERTPAQFFFECGYGAAYADAFMENGQKPAFTLSDAAIERAWAIAPEAHEDREEWDRNMSAMLSPSAQEPFGYFVEHTLAEPAFLRLPSYIPNGPHYTVTALYTRPTPTQEQGLLEEAEAVLERALIGSQKYLRARVRTAISLIEKARHSSTPTEGGEDA